MGRLTSLGTAINSEGKFLENVIAESMDSKVQVLIPKGTIGKNNIGAPLYVIVVKEIPTPPAPPAESRIIGQGYELGPGGATFDPPITFAVKYDKKLFPEGVDESNLRVGYWDDSKWQILESTVDTMATTVSTKVSHFSPYAIISIPPPPAEFVLSELAVNPAAVKLDEPVTISALLTNKGGSKGTFNVVLTVNDIKEAEKEITLVAGASEKASFTVTKSAAATYKIDVNGMAGSFTVATPLPPPPPAPPAPSPAQTLLPASVTPPAPVPASTMAPSPLVPTTTPEPAAEPSPAPTTRWLFPITIAVGVAAVGSVFYLFIKKKSWTKLR
jgi:hypothetical protein